MPLCHLTLFVYPIPQNASNKHNVVVLPLCVHVVIDLLVSDGEHHDEDPQEHHADHELVEDPHGDHGLVDHICPGLPDECAGCHVIPRQPRQVVRCHCLDPEVKQMLRTMIYTNYIYLRL